MNAHKQCNTDGFTLIELSIVIVMVGLLAAGIIVGQSMVRSSQVQSIITSEAKYVEAARQFKEKYGYPPGDFPNATSYWGTDPAGCPDTSGPYTTAQTTTCNGNGDGHIDAEGDATSGAQFYETWRAWQQLADAGLIEGAFTGQNGSTCSYQDVPGSNEPLTKLAYGGFEWNMFNGVADTTTTGWFTGIKLYTQYMLIGAASTGSGCAPLAFPLLNPSEALTLDTKVDDGMPTTGKWIAGNKTGTCESTASPPVYNVSSSTGKTATCSFAVEVDW